MPRHSKRLDWDDLRLIKALVETGGAAAAADRIGVDPSTVFRRLQHVEKALGVTVFDRHRTGYALTAAGAEVVTLANRVDEDVTDVTRRLAAEEHQPRGDLRVTTNDSLLVHLLTPIVARFAQRYLTVRVNVVLSNSALNLSKRDADVALRATDRPPDNLVGRRIARTAWAIYGRASDFPRKVPIEPSELAART